MVTIYNSDLFKEVREGIKTQQLRETIPSQLAEKIVPVMEVNPKLLRRAKPFAMASSLSNATSATIYTAADNKDTFLTGASVSMIKDVTATATDMALKCISPDSTVAYHLLRIAGITLTPQTMAISNSFVPPIQIKRGSNVTLTSDTNVGNIVIRAALTGYEIENINA
jgi:hypothetical protein